MFCPRGEFPEGGVPEGVSEGGLGRRGVVDGKEEEGEKEEGGGEGLETVQAPRQIRELKRKTFCKEVLFKRKWILIKMDFRFFLR